MKKIIILGATGSIGTQTLRVVRHLNDDFSIEGLSVNKNIEALEPLIYEFSPQAVAVCCSTQATILRKRIQGKSLTRVLEGMDGIIELASSLSADFVMSAMVGTAGLLPTIEAIKSKKNIGLANKEVLVTAGKIVMDLVKEHQVQLIPVDSEHSAIFQCLKGQDIHAVSKIILTASGGPFRGFSTQQLEKVQIQDALSHPNWTMGAKVSIDSSTLMNKGLELIEAKWLFDVDPSQLQVVVHPQSIIHSLVEYKDSSIIAQLGEPSMLTPIQYALTYPKRAKGLLKPFNFFKHSTLEFNPPDTEKFICLRLASEAMKIAGSMPCYMNAANEILVGRFLNKEIHWKDIGEKLESLMNKHSTIKACDINTLLELDQEARKEAQQV